MVSGSRLFITGGAPAEEGEYGEHSLPAHGAGYSRSYGWGKRVWSNDICLIKK
jgi:hypothetical protein